MLPHVLLIAILLSAPSAESGTAAAPETPETPEAPLAAAPSVAPGVEQAVRAALARRLAALANVQINYQTTADCFLSEGERQAVITGGKTRFMRPNGPYQYLERLSLLDGRTRMDSKLLGKLTLNSTLQALPPLVRSFVFTPDFAEKLEIQGQTPEGWLRKAAGLQPSLIEAALAMRALPDSTSRLTGDNYRNMKVLTDSADRVRLVAMDDFWLITWVLDRRYDYAPVSFSVHFRAGDYRITRMTMGNFHQVSGLELPFSIRFQALRRQDTGTMYVIGTQALDIKQYQFNSPENKPDLYRIDWPEGTLIHDASTNQDVVAHHGVLKPLPL